MKRHFFLAGLVLMALPHAVAAQETIEEKARVCARCHGENGVPTDPIVPIIWGQHAGYLYLQLKDFKAKRRASEKMGPIVEKLEKSELLALATYFESKPWPKTGYVTPKEDITTAQRVTIAGMCTACHNDRFTGDSVIPRIAGQTPDYLERILIAFKGELRANNPGMADMIMTFPDDHLKAMARYVAGR